jgi:SAM-dependent methyltransferase
MFDIGQHGQVVIDLGTGTGTLARGFARRGCNVVGVDIDPRMIAEAQKLDRSIKTSVRYIVAEAESTGLGSSSADAVTAGQCWHWFDRSKAGAEVRRLLKPTGKLVIAHFDWLPLAGNVVAATEDLIMQHNPEWRMNGGTGMHPQWLPELSDAGFRNLQTFSYDVDVPYTSEAWRGRIRASAGITALSSDEADEFDEELRHLLSMRSPSGVLAVPHRVFAIVAEPPSR